MVAVLIEKDGEQLVAYLVGPVRRDRLFSSWGLAGWHCVDMVEIPDPFPGVHRELVYSAVRPEDQRTFRP